MGLFGLLSGNSDGHAVWALLEIIQVAGTPRLVALGRRDDAGSSLILAADESWEVLLPENTWTHLAASFDFDDGTMALYRNGEVLAATYTSSDDNWQLAGEPEPDLASPSDPAGIKIGGSFPQNTAEKNAFNGRFDDLMFFDRELTATEIEAQFARFPRGLPTTADDRALGAGFRFSSYGPDYDPGPEYWAGVGKSMAALFSNASPEAIWIVGRLHGEGTLLSFPAKTESPLIHSTDEDANEVTLDLFDKLGVRVWLQVEPGNAPVAELIHLTL